MAKDGTARGGARIGSGKKPTNKKKAEVLTTTFDDMSDFITPDEIEGVEVPPIKDYLKAKQKMEKTYMLRIFSKPLICGLRNVAAKTWSVIN